MAGPVLVTFTLLPATILCPVLDSTSEPYCDLTAGIATVAHWAALSGGRIGAPTIGVLMLVLLITRHGMSSTRRTL